MAKGFKTRVSEFRAIVTADCSYDISVPLVPQPQDSILNKTKRLPLILEKEHPRIPRVDVHHNKDILLTPKNGTGEKADLWTELGDEYHSARKNLLKGIRKGRLRSAVRHSSAKGLFALLKGKFSGMRGDVARCKERTS
jgi:hypothetical protein